VAPPKQASVACGAEEPETCHMQIRATQSARNFTRAGVVFFYVQKDWEVDLGVIGGVFFTFA
jgi:hypothetical protein